MNFAKTGLVILFISLLLITWGYGYYDMLSLLPKGAHLWRQADCMAMTQNYHQFHLPFFQPEIYNLESAHGKVAGEFPIFYFIAAKFSNVVFTLRLLHTICLLLGFIGIYFIALYFLQRRFLALVACWLLSTSPLLLFYGNNFLSDVPALSFAFIGWAFFLYAQKQENYGLYLIAFSSFAFSGLLKASECLNFILVFLFLIRFKKLSLKTVLLFGFAVFPIAWYAYAKQYNLENHDRYYFLSISPIWKLSFYDIGLAIWRIVISNGKNFFWPPTSILLVASLTLVIKHRKHLDADLRWLFYASGGMTLLYLLLFYQKMIGHEYYYIPFLIFILVSIITILKTYNRYHAENIFSHALLCLFLIPNFIFCKNYIAEKLTYSNYNGYLPSVEMQAFLNQHGVSESKTILSLPDDSPNITLYLLKRKGYTAYNNYIAVAQQRQADYILLGNISSTMKNNLQPFLSDSIAAFNGYILYRGKK